MTNLCEVFVPIGGVVEEITILKWAYEHSNPINWLKNDAPGISVQFSDDVEAEHFKMKHRGFIIENIADLFLFDLDGLDVDAVKEWCNENLLGDWNLIKNNNISKIVIQEDSDILLFKMVFC